MLCCYVIQAVCTVAGADRSTPLHKTFVQEALKKESTYGKHAY
jgi:tRNA nucleotidyltransferase (CCA-adding enzyme)